MMGWLRRKFVAGFFVTVPLVVSVVAFAWLVRVADGFTYGLEEQFDLNHIPGSGIVAAGLLVLVAGVLATNVFGQRILVRAEQLLLHVPLFKTIYAPVKQIINAFSPDSEVGFKRMVLIDDETRGHLLGFLTKEFVVERGQGPETLLAVYVPTNHLYLGDILVCRPERVSYPDLTVEEGVRVFLTGGMGLPEHIKVEREVG
jgi:uncharacterized membrane protein